MPVELQFVDRATGQPVILLGYRQRFRFVRGELHFHHCPTCYEDGPCVMACEYEPDLSPEGEPLRGSHVVCDACRLFPERLGFESQKKHDHA